VIKYSKTQGFTLIEVMIGMVLTGILAMGMMGVWAMVGDQFFRSTIRQKAVFVLHGEMERLSALYRYEDYYTGPDHSNLDYIIHQTTVLETDLSHTKFPDDDLVIRKTTDASVLDGDFVQGQILYMDYVDPAAKKINIIWIDEDRNITAKLYWEVKEVDDGATAYPCYGTSNVCYLLTLNIEYPFRFQTSLNPATNIDTWTAENMTLQTIVGGR
jgi:prepilin-type N-terminal cleavage/methylation domain-containing protein